MEKVTLRGKQVELHSRDEIMNAAETSIARYWPHEIEDHEISGFGYLNFEVTRAYRMSVSLQVDFRNMRVEEAEEGRIGLTDTRITVNWPGGTRGVSEATASLALYQEVIALAALIEHQLNDMTFVGEVLERYEMETETEAFERGVSESLPAGAKRKKEA